MHDLQKLNRRQLDKLSDILSDIGVVVFASAVLPAVFDRLDLFRLLLGLLISVVLWIVSLRLRK